MNLRRKSTIGLAAGFILIGAGGIAIASVPSPEPCNSTFTGTATTAKLKNYIACRDDRIENKVDSLKTPAPTVTATVPGPTATVTIPGPTTTVTVTPSESPTPTPSSTPTSPSPTPTTSTPPMSFTTTPVDGGPNFYSRFTKNTLRDAKNWFPLGDWMEVGNNADRIHNDYKINMIVNPAAQDSTNPEVLNLGALNDEVDMWAGPGTAPWTGNYPGQGDICIPSTAQCGYTIMQDMQRAVAPGELRYTNYGKGVGFWETDTQAAKFVNDYQDVTSIDLYWGTDNDLCQASQGGAILGTGTALDSATCHKPSNYGRTVDRVRSLVSPAGSKPIFNYIEVGHPGSAGGQMPIAKIKPAVWSSLIHGARGIVYFNHSFGGTCQTQHVMDDCDPAIGQEVNRINTQILDLAPVLNSPTINGVTKSSTIDAMAKWDGTNVYLFAMPNTTGGTSGTVTIPGVGNGTATVIGESRTVPVINGQVTDTYADANVVHLYKLNLN